MKMPTATRQWGMYGLLLLTLALTAMAWFSDGDVESAAPVKSRDRRASPPVAKESSSASDDRLARDLGRVADRLRLRTDGTVSPADQADTASGEGAAPAPVDLFAAHSWYVPPPAPPPTAPKAPALPFRFIGKVLDGDEQSVFLEGTTGNYVAREGVTLDNRYLVERIEGDRMTLVYLPLRERQYLTLGAVN